MRTAFHSWLYSSFFSRAMPPAMVIMFSSLDSKTTRTFLEWTRGTGKGNHSIPSPPGENDRIIYHSIQTVGFIDYMEFKRVASTWLHQTWTWSRLVSLWGMRLRKHKGSVLLVLQCLWHITVDEMVIYVHQVFHSLSSEALISQIHSRVHRLSLLSFISVFHTF